MKMRTVGVCWNRGRAMRRGEVALGTPAGLLLLLLLLQGEVRGTKRK
jgi:hypothetical protein